MGNNPVIDALTSADPEPHETLARLQPVSEDLQLFIELITLCTRFLRLSSNASHLIGMHVEHRDGGQYAIQARHQLGLYDFDSHVVNESLQSNLSTREVSRE
jgi:hypothetical protein